MVTENITCFFNEGCIRGTNSSNIYVCVCMFCVMFVYGLIVLI